MLDTYLARNIHIKRGDLCIVHTDRGMELGRVINVKQIDKTPDPSIHYKKVLRKANEKDLALFEKKREKEEKAWDVCERLIQKHKLVMKLTRVEYILDGSKVIFYYTADGRVDFRMLVRDLAASLKTRIEMRQIGVRDEAKLLGGVGCCGLPLCCSTWLHKFQPVSIRTAKQQFLNLNPSRLSGLCGRLMCCLTYEDDIYKSDNEEDVEIDESLNEISESEARKDQL